ncbi:MAG: Alanine racemase [bacterium ADurb.Bin400]|nr:MAG: Alanine racemase [bacterium ADurb.Bin400]
MSSKPINHASIRTWIEVDKSAIQHNYQTIRRLIPDTCKLLAVAKSNAYGHGLFDYAKTVQQLGADWLAVDSITEAVALRRKGIALPMLVLGYTLPARFIDAARYNISLTVSNIEHLKALVRFKYSGQRIKLHLKIDTGMHRQGFFPDEMPEVAKLLKSKLPGFEVEGIYTHFAEAKDPNDRAETLSQVKQFNQAIKAIQQAGYTPIRHAAASAGTLNYPEAHFDLVRVGISLMGLWPAPETAQHYQNQGNLNLKPTLSWRSIVSEVKALPKGSKISYDFTETLVRDSRVAICPIGYWHGYPRSLSSVGETLVNGKRAKVLGRVTMDMIIIDVTDCANVNIGNTVTLIGKDGGDEVSAYELANKADMSYYELLTRINPLIKKYYR